MFKFGNIEINSKVILAPMAGVTSYGYRKFVSQFKPGYMVTEMVSDMGLIYGNEETKKYVCFDRLEIPTGVQLFGNCPKNMAKAALICENLNPNIDFYDINMGCPVPKVTNSGAGSALMKNPRLCGDIVRTLKTVTDKPVTAKIRLGWDNNSLNYLEVIKELEKAGVDMIGIHARTRKELYCGSPHYELLKDLRKQMSVPLSVSGNIYSLDDAIHAIDITGADSVMVARGGVGNPFLVKQINEYYKTGERLESPSLKEQLIWCEELAKRIVEEKGEYTGMRVYRSIAPKFFSGIRNIKKYRLRLTTELETLDSLNQILKEIAEDNGIEF